MFFLYVLVNVFIFSYYLGIASQDDVLVKEWKCANPDCTVPISDGKTDFPYQSPDHKLKLKFKQNDIVQVLRKPSENEKEQNFWWISLDGKQGYAHKSFIKEKKVNVKNKDLLTVRVGENHSSIPISPTPSFTVSEGTTIYTNYKDEESQTDNINYSAESATEHDDEVDSFQVDEEDEEDEEAILETPNIYKDAQDSTVAVSSNADSAPSDKPDIVNATKPVIVTSDNLDIAASSMPDVRSPKPETANSDVTFSEPIIAVSPKPVIAQSPVADNNLKAASEIGKNPEDLKVKVDNILGFKSEHSDYPPPPNLVSDNSKIDLIEKSDENKTNNSPNSVPNDSPVRESDSFTSKLTSTSPLHSDFQPDKQNTEPVKHQIIQDETLGNSSIDSNQGSPLIPNENDIPPIISLDTNSEVNTNVPPAVLRQDQDIVIRQDQDIQQQNILFSHHPNNEVVNNQEENSITPSPYTTEKSLNSEINLAKPLIDDNFTSSESTVKNETSDNTSFDSGNEKKVETEENIKIDEASTIIPVVQTEHNEPIDNLIRTYVPLLNEDQKKETLELTTETSSLPIDFNKNDEEVKDRTKSSSDSYENPQEIKTEFYKLPKSESVVHPEESSAENKSNDEIYMNKLPDSSISHPTEKITLLEEQNISSKVELSAENKSADGDTYMNELYDSSTSIPSEESFISDEKSDLNENMINVENYETSQKWYSSLYSFMDSLKELYVSSFGETNNISALDTLEKEVKEPLISQPECQLDQGTHCELKESPLEDGILVSPQETIIPNTDSEPENLKVGENIWSYKSILWLIVSSLVVLCFSLGYYYLENVHRDGELVRKNNLLASELFVLEREKALLEEDFGALKAEVQKLSDERYAAENQLTEVIEELQNTKEEKFNIEERETKLIEKLNMVEKNYNELRRIFSESKQKGERATITSYIRKLKESIAADNVEISSLKDELQEKKNEIKLLNNNLKKSQEAKIALEERLDKMVIENQGIAKEYQVTLAKMEQTIEENKIVHSTLENDLRKQIKTSESLKIQLELAESALQKAHGITSSESLAEWLQIKEVRINSLAAEKELDKLNQDKQQLLKSLESEKNNAKFLTKKVEELNDIYENAEKEKIEALTKLQVLSNYFKEKETQLQEELGMKESQWLQKQSDDSTIYQQMRDLREENINLKGLVETLKREILDQESAYKKIINTTEQKAQENWVSYRRTEVRLKEVQAEAAQLRNRLTTLETSDVVIEDKMNKTTGGLEMNGDLPPLGSAMSPPFMLYPNEFIPPPPLLPAGGNPTSRPPPLGRISSPPLVSGDFIPPPPILPSPFDLYSHIHPPPPSPPPPLLHKPQPRDHHPHQNTLSSQVPPPSRKQKDSQSSNHSSESLHDKTPARKSKR